MANNEFYKIYQLAEIFVSKYSYIQINLNKYQDFKDSETWFANGENPNYQLIRVSFQEASNYMYDAARIEDYISYMNAYLKKEVRFLDIHLSKTEYVKEFEPFDYLNLEENYFAGCDISNIFPEVYSTVHTVENREKEIKKIADSMISSIKQRRNKLIFKHSMKAYVTVGVIGVCVILQLISTFLSLKFSSVSSLIFMGALYNTFSLGLGQFYRLISYAFLHGGFLHLFFNMYALYHIGVFMENELGHLKYAVLLFSSILAGGLCQAILCGNTICVGMSGGIYGLFVVYIAILLGSHIINLNQLFPTIMINIALNFMSQTAWAGHLGGAMVGFVFYYILKEENNKNYGPWILLGTMILALLFKYYMFGTIDQFFGGTDQEVLGIYRYFGLDGFADKTLIKLIQTYSKFRGV